MHLLISWSIVVVIFGNLNYWLLAYRLLTCGDEALVSQLVLFVTDNTHHEACGKWTSDSFGKIHSCIITQIAL